MINGKQTKNKQSNVYTSEQRNRWIDKNKDMREWKIFIETQHKKKGKKRQR